MQERKSFDFPPKILYENRYCNQDDFSVLVCGVKFINNEVKNNVFKLDGLELKSEKQTCMQKKLYNCEVAVVDSDLFVFGGCSQNGTYDKYIRKFCNKTKTWSTKKHFYLNEKRNLYVVYETNRFCIYSLKNNYLLQLANTKEKRYFAAYTIFEGKIFVTGGIYTKSVEAYDYY